MENVARELHLNPILLADGWFRVDREPVKANAMSEVVWQGNFSERFSHASKIKTYGCFHLGISWNCFGHIIGRKG